MSLNDVALCLSGGGFRATLFHLGTLRRLNELGVLSRVGTITSVSGGSIINGVLASRWDELTRDSNGVFINFYDKIVAPVYEFCATDLRSRMVVGARLSPSHWRTLLRSYGSVSANLMASSYQPLFRDRLLADVVEPRHAPRFIFCATSTQTGACWHFHGGPEGRMGDFYTGYTDVADVSIAEAVAASSAFPFAIGGLRLRVQPGGTGFTRVDPWGHERPDSRKRQRIQLAVEDVILTDGGVYDNLGVEPVWDRYPTLLISDAGLPLRSQALCRQGLAARLYRASLISMEQVGAVRKRWLYERLEKGLKTGAMWSINTIFDDYPIDDKNGYPGNCACLFPFVRTDLNAFTEGEMKCLENHGYSLSDAAIRSRAPQTICSVPPSFRWPNPDWVDTERVCAALNESGRRRIISDTIKFVGSLLKPPPSHKS